MADKKNSDLVGETTPNDDGPATEITETPIATPVDEDPAKSPDVADAIDEGEADSNPPLEIETHDPAPQVEAVKEIKRIIEKRGGFGMAFVGGVVAAGLGFVAGQTQLLNPILPAGLTSATVTDLQAVQAGQGDLNTALADLRAQLATFKAPDLSAVMAQIDALATQIAPLTSGLTTAKDHLDTLATDVAALTNRLSDLEKRPLSEGVSAAAVAAYEAELAKLQDSLVAQRLEVEQMVAQAQALDAASAESARIASAQTMVARLRSRLDGGTAYSAILTELKGVDVTVPSALQASAENGVATLAALTTDFVPAARAALAAARQDSAGTGGLLAYAQRHLGARSVTPRQGGDPDAILSRAEAAIAAGRLDQALVEIMALPDSARTALLGWETAAKTRQAAITAADELAQSLNAN